MPNTLDLLHRKIEFQSAVEHESNILAKLTYVLETRKVYANLSEHAGDIQSIAAHHLGVNRSRCIVSHWRDWIRGSFNVCIPVVVDGQDGQPNKTILMRCPMAYRLSGDASCVDEKIGGEVAAYAWVQENCPEIKTPDLLGFGFTDGRSVSTSYFQNVQRLIFEHSVHSRITTSTLYTNGALSSPFYLYYPSTLR